MVLLLLWQVLKRRGKKEGRKEGTGGYLLQLLLHCPVDEHLFYDLDDKVDDDTHE